MFRVIFIAICMGLGTLCGCSHTMARYKSDKALHEFIGSFSKTMRQKYNVELSGTGGGENEGIWLVTIYFSRYSNDQLTIENARKILIDAVDQALVDINNNEDLRPFLKNYPFTTRNLSIAFMNYSEKAGTLYYPDICSFGISNNEIVYNFRNPDKKTMAYYKEVEETYEEALELLRNAN